MTRVIRLLLFVAIASPAHGHGGGLDQNGGHHDRKNGGYHYHRRKSPSVERRSSSYAPSITRPQTTVNKFLSEPPPTKTRPRASATSHTDLLPSNHDTKQWAFFDHARTWTSSGGTSTLLGVPIKSDGTVIWLMPKAEVLGTIPLANVSADDIAFVTPPEHLSAFKNALFGFVEQVKDGDTIAVRSGDGTLYDVRLQGIDAPEDDQDFGTRATSLLSYFVEERFVVVYWYEWDRYHRVLGHVYVGDDWINRHLVELGAAWHYAEYSNLTALADAEQLARLNARGLWAAKNAEPPWEFRSTSALRSRRLATSQQAE